ncbi:tyrosine-type recombinase/integrase [Filimonas effusa]|uniref:Tyrosine recombinase XerC n=1 Tax=Filimonas effusa TaxID=2508721 RepID=A0A4Q1DCC9_9BACT|nr:tyrosine-type recombinase/integrase [Filimonas effusa]RXK87117.1 integrase [Filimonas effusa]
MLDSYQPPIQRFIDYLRFEKRYSQHTVLSYQNDLEQFLVFLVADFDAPPLSRITSGMVRTWLASLKEEKYTARSIQRKISALRTFFKVLIREGMIAETPMTTIVTPKSGKRLPAFVAEADMQTLFSHVEFPGNWKGKTDRLILILFYHTGIRVSELVNLKESQLDVSYAQLKVLGKGNKERIIPLNPALVNEMQDYIAQKKNKAPKQNAGIGEEQPAAAAGDRLFVTEAGKPLNRSAVYQSVKFYLAQVTTLEKKSPHILRHTFATHLTNAGADLNAVKELLGHASLAATQVYTHNTIEKLKDVFRKAHPKA